MVKAALWIFLIVGVAWFTFAVRLGPQPLAGHLHDIWGAKESQALRQGFSDEAQALFGHRPVHPTVKASSAAAAEAKADHPPLDPVAADDREQLGKLVSAKTAGRRELPAHHSTHP